MKCKDCEHLCAEGFGAYYCEILFKEWSVGKYPHPPYVNPNSTCKLNNK